MKRPMNGLVVMMALTGAMAVAGCPTVRGPVTPGKADSTVAASADSTGWGKAALPKPDLGYNAREGRALYRHYCLNCHGEVGAGDGFNAYNLDPRPRALADSVFQTQHADDDLANAIRSGGSAVGLSTGMPPWGRALNERKIRNLVEYVRSLRESSDGSR